MDLGPFAFGGALPLTSSGSKVMSSMKKTYGSEKGERVFYASVNKGKPGSKKWHKKSGRSLGGSR